MISKDYKLGAFFIAIKGLPEMEAMYIANNEATEVERFLIKKGVTKVGIPSEDNLYANTLKQFIQYLKSGLGVPKSNEPGCSLYGSYLESITKGVQVSRRQSKIIQ